MDPIQLTKQLVAIKSSFEAPPYETEVGAFVESWLQAHGFRTRRLPVETFETIADGTPTRFNVLAEKGSGEKSLLIYGHMDTVPRVAGWSTDAWTPHEDGDRLYGLGAHDMKSGLAAVMCAAAAVEPDGYSLKLAVLVDEENMSRGAYALIRDSWAADAVLALVPESGTSNLQAQGARMITLGRRGRVTIQVDVGGVSAHAADPSKGVSALHRAAMLVVGLHEALDAGQMVTAEHPQLTRGSFSIRSLHSDAQSLSIPDHAQFLIDRHLVPGETPDLALAEVRRVVEGLYKSGRLERADHLPIRVSLRERVNPYLMPYVTPDDHPYVQQVEAVIRQTLGVDSVAHNYGLSVADENYFGSPQALGGLGLPVIVIGPMGDRNHAADEWVSLSSVRELAEVYKNILRQIRI